MDLGRRLTLKRTIGVGKILAGDDTDVARLLQGRIFSSIWSLCRDVVREVHCHDVAADGVVPMGEVQGSVLDMLVCRDVG